MHIPSALIRYAFGALTAAASLTPLATNAEDLDLRFITADGTWDCLDPAEAKVGTVVVADERYAFIRTDGKLGGYGDLYRLGDDYAPRFSIMNGYLLDEFGARGASLTGPRGHYEDLQGELWLYIAVTGEREKNWYCARRR